MNSLKKNKIFILFIALLYCNIGYAQYQWDGKKYSDPDTISYKKNTFSVISYKGYKNKIRFYIKNDEKKNWVIKQLDLKNLHIDAIDTISDDFLDFRITDIIAMDNQDVILGLDRILIYNRLFHTSKRIDYHNIDFSHGYSINDSLILLNVFYNFHPFDGFAGLNMQLFNINTDSIINSKTYIVPGIALTSLGINPVIYADNKILFASPLTDELYVYDLNLVLAKIIKLPIKFDNIDKNLEFEKSVDKHVYDDWNYLYHLAEKIGKDSVRKQGIYSNIYTKDFIKNMNDSVHSNYEYIEKLLPYNDSIFIMTISKPGYNYSYRDVVFYNINQNIVTRYIDKWSCHRKDTLNKFEDFFDISVISDVRTAPYFDKDKIYYRTDYDPALYQNGRKDSLDKIIHNDIIKNNYRWSLLEYKLQ